MTNRRLMLRLFAALAIIAVAIGAAVAAPVRTIPSGTVTIPAGETTADIGVEINGDTAAEGDERYTVTISSSTLQIGQATAQGTIINDDGVVAPVISVSAPTTVKSGTVLNVTLARAGDKRGGDRVRWAVVPLGAAGVAEDDFPAVLEDVFDGSSLGDEWCATDADDQVADGCPASPEAPLYGTWESGLVTVSSGSLRLGIDHDAGDWTTSQVVSKRAFGPGLLKYAVQFPAGKGGAHAIWRAPEDHYYGPGPRSGQLVDVVYFGKTAGERNKTWLSQLQYSGLDEFAEPAIAGQINDGTVWSDAGRAAQTRWWKTDADGKTRFAFRLGNTVFWQPVEGDWPATESVITEGTDEDGSLVQTLWPGGGGASPFDRPMRIVMQSGVGGATSIACTGETSCPDSSALDGANVLVDYVRYYQFPTGEVVFQPGQDRVTLALPTRDSGVAGVRNLRFILMSADDASISSSAGKADVAMSTQGDPGVDHGEETYFLDFGKDAGGFTDSFGTTWANGNEYVTGGTALSDLTTGGGGGWTTDIEGPPDMTDALVTTNKCPGDEGWPTRAESAGKNLKFVMPTDRDCILPKGPGLRDPYTEAVKVGGTEANPANNVWIIGGKYVAPDGPWTGTGVQGNPAITLQFIKGTTLIEGVHIDNRCTCRDTIGNQNLGHYEDGATLKGPQPVGKTPRVIVQNSYLTGTTQCVPGGHGDSYHSRGSGTLPELKFENLYAMSGFQSIFVENKTDSFPGHGFTKMKLNHVFLEADPNCGKIPDGTKYGGGKISWYGPSLSSHADKGITFINTYVKIGSGNYAYGSIPQPAAFDAKGCVTSYKSAAGAVTGTWCKGDPPNGSPVSASRVGRNYNRTTFLGTGQPPVISGAKVPRLDHTRLVGNTMQIVIPVDTTRGRQRLVTLGFSARDETATGQRKFDIAGNIVRSGYDIFANAGARDTETRITAPVTIGDDGFLRLTLTGTTGQAQINWMTIQRPTVGVTMNKTQIAEGETVTATLRRSAPTEPEVRMGWVMQGAGDSPTSGADFTSQTASGEAVFPSGAIERTVSFTAAQDGIAEPEEGFTFSLTGGAGADIDPAQASVSGTIAASLGPPDPCEPGGSNYPCVDPCEPGGANYPCENDDVCYPEGAVRKTVRVEAGKTVQVSKTFMTYGLTGYVRDLRTKCSASTVCYGPGPCLDPKGLQADAPLQRSVRVEAANVTQRTVDTFTYKVCKPPLFTDCTPVVVDVIISPKATEE